MGLFEYEPYNPTYHRPEPVIVVDAEPPPSKEVRESAVTEFPRKTDPVEDLNDELAKAAAHLCDQINHPRGQVTHAVLLLRGVLAKIERVKGPKVHALKVDPDMFELAFEGVKRYEVRKMDRDFRVGDLLKLCEYDRVSGEYSGRMMMARVDVITPPNAYGLPDGLCVMGITRTE